MTGDSDSDSDSQKKVGGKRWCATPKAGRVLGPSSGNPGGDWWYHAFVVSGGLVYDPMNDVSGMPLGEYTGTCNVWSYFDAIDFSPQ